MRVFVPAGEQVHQGGAAVSETDESGKRLGRCGCQAKWVLCRCRKLVETAACNDGDVRSTYSRPVLARAPLAHAVFQMLFTHNLAMLRS